MNERIKELAERAGLNSTGIWHIVGAYHEKFAELIVKKCANIVWDEAQKTGNSDVNDAGYKIIEYFHGVEE